MRPKLRCSAHTITEGPDQTSFWWAWRIAIPPGVPSEPRWAMSQGFRVLLTSVRRPHGEPVSVAFHISIATPHSALDRFEPVTTQLDDANEGFATDSLIPRISQRSKRRLDAWASNVAAQMLESAGLGETPAGEPPTTAPGESAG